MGMALGSHEKAGEDPAGIYEKMFRIYGQTMKWYNTYLAVKLPGYFMVIVII